MKVISNPLVMAFELDYERIIEYFGDWGLDDASRYYVRFHAKRYAFLLKLLQECIGKMPGKTCERLLDIGPGFLTQLLREGGIAETVDSLGCWDDRFKCRDGDAHFEFDLKNTVDRTLWPRPPLYDLVVMAEVIEHLPVSPSHVFAFLASLVRPGGYLLLQTPNACSLSKRLKMLVGRNPFELIRDNLHNPGHFREYTVRELAGYAGASGFKVRGAATANYFSGERLCSRVAAGISFALPPPLRNGITLWLVRG